MTDRSVDQLDDLKHCEIQIRQTIDDILSHLDEYGVVMQQDITDLKVWSKEFVDTCKDLGVIVDDDWTP